MHEESEREVLDRIESTRARMGDTIEQIGDRVNPDRVQRELKARAREQVRDAKDNVKQKARNTMRDIEHEVTDSGRSVWHTIRDNPIPAGMVGVGLAWLMANGSGSSRPDRDEEYWGSPEGARRGGYGYAGYTGVARPGADYVGREYGYDGPREVADTGAGYPTRDSGHDEAGFTEDAKERVSGAAESARERTAEAAEQVKHKAEDAVDTTREKASELAHRASEGMDELRYRSRRAERRVENAVQDNPLAAGALAAALGFAAGMMIPETERENEMFGPTRDRMMEKAETTARRTGEKAKDVARDTAREAGRAVDEAWPGLQGDRQESYTEPRR
ncbi:MAG TPA: DUF3618 domain-containing protein [Longimicrobiales bacterium]|nr:DUF3618 domain-containing protein [Longimicrobiales bacterium]